MRNIMTQIIDERTGLLVDDRATVCTREEFIIANLAPERVHGGEAWWIVDGKIYERFENHGGWSFREECTVIEKYRWERQGKRSKTPEPTIQPFSYEARLPYGAR